MIELVNISKKYSTRKKSRGNREKAVEGINLSFSDTGLHFICGKSGSGKSTLLNLIGSLDFPTSGQIKYNGTDINRLSRSGLDAYRNKTVGFVFQDYGLIADMTASANCMLPVLSDNAAISELKEKSYSVLRSVGLEGLEERRIKDLSGGEKQRVSIARAIMQESKILLCDEPTGNLDPDTADSVFGLLKKLSEKICVIAVSHDYRLAEKYGDSTTFINDGVVQNKTGKVFETQNRVKEVPHGKGNGGFRVFRSILRMNIYPKLLFALLIVIVLSLLLSVMLASEFVGKYSHAHALASSLADYNESVIPVCGYCYSYDEEENTYDFTKIFDETDVSTLTELKESIPDGTFGNSYNFGKTMQDFFGSSMESRTDYYCGAFTKLCTFENDELKKTKVKYGTYPQEDDEVLIYDYMAENIIYFAGSDELKEVSDVVGYELRDSVTGFSMKISGVLESKCDEFRYIDTEKADELNTRENIFVESYLSSLRIIIGNRSFESRLENEKNYISCLETVSHEENSSIGLDNMINLGSRKIERVSSFENFDFLYLSEYTNYGGFFISDTLYEKLTGSSALLCSERLSAYDGLSFGIIPHYVYFRQSMYFSYENDNIGYDIIGVFRSDEESIYYYNGPEADFIGETGEFSCPVILLSGNISSDTKTISALLPDYGTDSKTEGFNPDDYTGYTYHTYFSVYLKLLDSFFADFAEIGSNCYWVLWLAVVMILLIFVLFSVHKNKYNIGVLKSVGTTDLTIFVSYGVMTAAVTAFSFAISVFLAELIMDFLNGTFSETIRVSYSFFSADLLAEVSTSATIFAALLIVLAGIFAYFFTKRPVVLKK